LGDPVPVPRDSNVPLFARIWGLVNVADGTIQCQIVRTFQNRNFDPDGGDL
jgi:hypothetical protein